MIEVEINGDKFWENIDRYDEKNFEYYYFKPKTEKFKEYWAYVKNIGRYSKNNIKLFYKFHPEINEKDCRITNVSTLKHFVIFEFPDDYPEEDLFYFKMKYS